MISKRKFTGFKNSINEAVNVKIETKDFKEFTDADFADYGASSIPVNVGPYLIEFELDDGTFVAMILGVEAGERSKTVSLTIEFEGMTSGAAYLVDEIKFSGDIDKLEKLLATGSSIYKKIRSCESFDELVDACSKYKKLY